MKLLLTSIIFTQAILFAFVSGDCEDDWTSMADENGVSIGFKLFKRDYKINYYHAQVICKENGANVAIIHNDIENGLVQQMSGPSTTNWIGTHIIPNSDNKTVSCFESDKSRCVYGAYNSTSDPARQDVPWLPIDQIPSTDEFGDPIECVKLIDTSFEGFDPTAVAWLEDPCYDRIDGVICSKSCDN
uniref:C-type lectin domain-containing protein n=1 Tax=Meloidogyne incognita TaxID=6306 RepID=A0A914M4L3_MELIC